MDIILEQLGFLSATGSHGQLIRDAKKAGIKGLRMFYLHNFGRENPISPFKKVGRWTAGGRGDFPYYDMTQPDLVYWEIFDMTHRYLKENGMEAHGVLHDRCSFDYQNDRFNDPFWSSVQKYPDPNDKANKAIKGGIYGEEMKTWHTHWYELIAARLNSLGVPYKLEPVNEFRNFPLKPTGYSKDQYFAWMRWAVKQLVFLGVPKSRIITSVLDEDQWFRYYGLGTVYSHHGCVTPKKTDRILKKLITEGKADPKWIIISGDGGRDGKGEKDPNPKKGWKGLGDDDAEVMGKQLEEAGIQAYGYMSRASKPIRGSFAKGGKEEDLNEVNFNPAARMYLGAHPLPPEPPTPEPPQPVPPAPPTPPQKKPWWYWWFGENSLWAKFWKWIRSKE